MQLGDARVLSNYLIINYNFVRRRPNLEILTTSTPSLNEFLYQKTFNYSLVTDIDVMFLYYQSVVDFYFIIIIIRCKDRLKARQ